MESSECVHPITKHRTRDGRKFSHGALPEAQIHTALQLSDLDLKKWAHDETRFFGPLSDEAILFLIQVCSSDGRSTDVSNELTALLHDKLKGRIISSYRGKIGTTAAEEFASQCCSAFWIRVFDWESAKSAWAQVCFWPSVFQFAKDAMKSHKVHMGPIVPLDSDIATRSFVREIPSRDIGLDDLVYIKEVLSEMKPSERLAFALRHSFDASIKEIGTVTGYSETKVKTLLRKKNKQLRKAA